MPDVNQEQGSGPSPEVIAEARTLGWVPKEEFRGDPARWADADAFVQRGHEIMPILRANNQRLMGELTSMQTALAQANEAITQLRESSAEIVRDRVKAAKAELMQQLTAAKKDGDAAAEAELTEKLIDIRVAEKGAGAPPSAAKAEPGVDPAFTAWKSQPGNEWFGVDRRKTSLAIGIAQELRAAGETMVGVKFYEKVAQEVDATLNPRRDPPADKVEGSRGGAGTQGGGSTRTKGYNQLPEEAKAACDKQAKKFAGTAAFKTEADYRTHYAKLYFAEE